MISLDRAWQILQQIESGERQFKAKLLDCDQKFLAQDLIARRTHPPTDLSAMDGYAIHKKGEIRDKKFRVIGESSAGHPFDERVGEGEAVRISTGAALPQGANQVVIQEHVQLLAHNQLLITHSQNTSHIRKAGLDFEKNERLVQAGVKLHPALLALAAASGHHELTVRRPPHIAILTCGDELTAPGEQINAEKVINSAPFALAPLIQNWGGKAEILPVAKDNRNSIKGRIAQASTHDLILAVGGASVGPHDHVKPAFLNMGYELLFSKVKLKPGKPVWFGRKVEGKTQKYVLGLPGNPASCLVTAHLLLRGIVARLLGAHDPFENLPWKEAIAAQAWPANGSRETFLRAEVKKDDMGQLFAQPYPAQDSSLLHPFARCHWLLRRPPNAAQIDKGERVQLLSLLE